MTCDFHRILAPIFYRILALEEVACLRHLGVGGGERVPNCTEEKVPFFDKNYS